MIGTLTSKSYSTGIHKVDIEVETGKVSVKGVFDPVKIHKRIEKKTKKKVELISPKPKEKVDKPPEKKEVKKKEVNFPYATFNFLSF